MQRGLHIVPVKQILNQTVEAYNWVSSSITIILIHSIVDVKSIHFISVSLSHWAFHVIRFLVFFHLFANYTLYNCILFYVG